MANILDYISWRGDITFKERPLNEVDNLIFSEIVYFNFSSVMNRERSITIREAYSRYMRMEEKDTYGTNDPVPLLAACAGSERFGSVQVQRFVNTVDAKRQIQFAAATFLLENHTVFVAFRGTDNTITGWREDFNFSFMEETPAQSEAVKYLEGVFRYYKCHVTVGGHSKGGNLAIYAAAFCNNGDDMDRLDAVYSNDGPGFKDSVIENPLYQRVLPKVTLIIPDSSVIGIIFSNDAKREVVKSSAFMGAYQHDPYTWLTEREWFVKADGQSSSSAILDETLNGWLSTMNMEQRKLFFSSIFDVLDASGAHTLADLNKNKWISYNAILKAAAGQSDEVKSNFGEAIKKLAATGRDIIWNEAKKRFEPFKHTKE